MDAAINDNVTDDGIAYVSSIAEDIDGARTDFNKYGYYTKSDFIYKVNIDSSNLAESPNYESDLEVIFLNTNACNNRNWGLMEEMLDPGL